MGLGRRQLHGDLVGDLFSELTLQREYVFELSVVTIGPERFVGACGDELDIQPHTPADEMCRAFENHLHVQFPGDLRERQRRPLVFIADVLEMTRKALMRARSEMTALVMPSAKYSCVASCETLRNGRTAIPRIVSLDERDDGPRSPLAGGRRNEFATAAADAGRRLDSSRGRRQSAGRSERWHRSEGIALMGPVY